MSGNSGSKVAKGLVRGLVFLASLVAIAFLIRALQLPGLLDTAWVDARIRGQGLSGELLFLGAGVLFTAAGLPRQVVSFLGGYAFGFVAGTLLALVATVGGCVATFYYARFLGRSFVAQRFPARIRRADQFLRENPFSTTLLIRLIPVGSNVITNLVAGVSSVPAGAFLLGSVVGFIPQTVVFALVGSGIEVAPVFRITLGTALFVASGAIGIFLYRRNRSARAVVENDGDAG